MPSNWIDELIAGIDDMTYSQAKAIIESKLIEARADEVEKAKHNVYHTSDMYRENPSIYFAERKKEIKASLKGGDV